MASHLKVADVRHLLSGILTPNEIAEIERSERSGGKAKKASGDDWRPLPTMPGAKSRLVCDLPTTGRPGPWTTTIPKWHPALINHLLGDWRRTCQRKRSDLRMIYFALFAAGVPRATRKRKLTLTLTYRRGQTCCDSDAPFKSLNDALTKIGAWVDDSPRWSKTMPLIYGEPGARRETVILLEDME